MRVISQDAVKVAAADLRAHPQNPRRGNVFGIKQSIQENGFYGSLLVQQRTNFILAGWHRFLAGCELGIAYFPVRYVACDAETALRILLADNRTSDVAGYSDQSLLDVLDQLQESYGAAELVGTGYDPDDVALLVKQLRGEETARVGEYTFPLERQEYCNWLEDLHDAAGFNHKKIFAEILRRMDLDPAS